MFSLDQILAGYKAGEFFLEYLPTVSLVDRRCVGAEALIRWRRPERVVPPLEFIRQVEHTPFSGILTYWVMETIGTELGDWLRRTDGVYISLNVPPEILGRGGLHYVVEKSNLRDLVGKLMLEITERGVPDALGIAALSNAYRAGALIALDDVNLSDANLVVLSRIRTDVVKFDKSFADRMLLPDWNDKEIDTLTALMQSAHYRIIIEGVETARQVEILSKAGVEWAQGFYFSEPLPAPDFIEFFKAHQ